MLRLTIIENMQDDRALRFVDGIMKCIYRYFIRYRNIYCHNLRNRKMHTTVIHLDLVVSAGQAWTGRVM
jgi:hypothetical protein